MYDDQDDMVHSLILPYLMFLFHILFKFIMFCSSFDQDDARSNHIAKKDQPNREAAGAGKRDNAKVTKKAGKWCFHVYVNLYS